MKVIEKFEKGKRLFPSFELQPATNEILAIQTNAQRKEHLLQQLQQDNSIYTYRAHDGEYERLTVKELLRFLAMLTSDSSSIDALVERFRLQTEARVKIRNLSVAKQHYVRLLRVFFAQQQKIVLEEPFFYLDDEDRFIMKQQLQLLAATKEVLIITSNFEDALMASTHIYRLEEDGMKQLDIASDEEPAIEEMNDEPAPIKFEKISTRKNEKVILFDPPEIDYIESVEGSIIVHVGGENYTCAMTLTELEKRLQYYGFFRCHRSYIVNLQKVREIITWSKNSYSLRLHVQDDSVVPLSRTKLQQLKELLNI